MIQLTPLKAAVEHLFAQVHHLHHLQVRAVNTLSVFSVSHLASFPPSFPLPWPRALGFYFLGYESPPPGAGSERLPQRVPLCGAPFILRSVCRAE